MGIKLFHNGTPPIDNLISYFSLFLTVTSLYSHIDYALCSNSPLFSYVKLTKIDYIDFPLIFRILFRQMRINRIVVVNNK